MKKKLFTSILCLLLLLIMMLSTTLAWFTDSQGSVNVMVSGNISIDQKEYSNAAHTEPFENNQFVMMPSDTVVKEVVVTNDGNQQAYIRTLFAFEDKAYTDEKGVARTVLDMLTTTGGDIKIPSGADKIQFTVTKDGMHTIFTVGYYVHNAAVEVNEDIVPLKSITLESEATNAWRSAVGETYELFVLSQATQTVGVPNDPADALNNAFAHIDSANCADWFGAMLTANNYGQSAVAPNAAP